MLYPIAIEPGDDQHAYGVTVPDLTGCFSAGESYEDAVKQAREAIELHLEGMAEDGAEIPLPRGIEEHRDNPEYRDRVWALVDVDLSQFMGKAEKINVTLPARLIRQIDDKVEKDTRFKTRSGFLAEGAIMLLNSSKIIG